MTARDNRLLVEAVLYRHRVGISWRDLPERFGSWKAVHMRFSRWAKGSVWERLLRHLATDADTEYAMLDSTVVRAHQHAAGAHEKGAREGDRAQQGWLEHQDPRSRGCARQSGRLCSGWRPGT
jgi:transposase